MEPASEYGRAAMDELHQQTVNLLSFQTLPREQYDAQVAFNLLPELGEAAKVKLGGDGATNSAPLCGLIGGTAAGAGVADWCRRRCFMGMLLSVLVEVGEAGDCGRG